LKLHSLLIIKSARIKEDVTEFIQSVLTISALNVLGIKNQHPKILIQISDVYTNLQHPVLILYERKELFSYQKSLFDNLVIYVNDNEESKAQLKTRNIY
jgi:hypothetical protein